MAFLFEKLEVYQAAVDFPDQIAALTESFLRGYRYLTDQLSRASLSIAANLAEGSDRFTQPDCKHFFSIARGTTQEGVPLLQLASRRRLLEPDRHAALRQALEEIARMIYGLIQGLEKRAT